MRQSVQDAEEIGDGTHVQESPGFGRGWCGRPIPVRWVPWGESGKSSLMCIRSPAVTPARSMEPRDGARGRAHDDVRRTRIPAAWPLPGRRESPRGRRPLRTLPLPGPARCARRGAYRRPPHISVIQIRTITTGKTRRGRAPAAAESRRQAAGPRIRPRRRLRWSVRLGRRPAATVASTITTPTPNTIHRVVSGSTQKLPTIGEAAISKRKEPLAGSVEGDRPHGRSIFARHPGEVQLARMSAAMRPVPSPER